MRELTCDELDLISGGSGFEGAVALGGGILGVGEGVGALGEALEIGALVAEAVRFRLLGAEY
jgi:hypothetical protein